METLNVCPSMLAEGFDTYSPAARKLLFDGKAVSHILDFDSPNNECRQRGICPACRTHIPFPKLKINAHLFGSLLTYSYLCKREVFTVVNI